MAALDAVEDDIGVLEEWLETPGRRLLQARRHAQRRSRSKSLGPAPGIAVRKGETDLVNKFNAAIDAIRANGKYKEINDKYFKFDVYGGES